METLKRFCFSWSTIFEYRYFIGYFRIISVFGNDFQSRKLFILCYFGLSTLYGLLFVFPIGGADMPVVISLLNSFTGVAAACGEDFCMTTTK